MSSDEIEEYATRDVIRFHEKEMEKGATGMLAEDKEYIRNIFANSHINFILGAGFCGGVIPTLGGREEWLAAAHEANDEGAQSVLQYEFYRNVLLPMADASPTEDMVDFVRHLKRLLAERGTTSIPRKASLFTTNYDSLLEEALEKAGVSFNDGFEGRSNPVFATRSYGRVHYAQSLALEYSSQIPTVNVVKLHGSVTWQKKPSSSEIHFRDGKTFLSEFAASQPDILSEDELGQVQERTCEAVDSNGLSALKQMPSLQEEGWADTAAAFLTEYRRELQLVNPTKNKFEETVMGLVYYELLRLFANELDRNNALLLSFGFSFADEHISEIVKRALDNPQLLLAICCHTPDDEKWYRGIFKGCDNVRYIVPDEKFELNDLCTLLSEVR